MRFVMIGDVGGHDTYHIGDEAMLEANLAELRRRYHDSHFTIVSSDPEATSARLGVEAVSSVGFHGGPRATDDERRCLLDDVMRHGEEVARGHTAPRWEVVEALRRSDGLILSGGGNLNSNWPEHLYERVALLRLARAFEKWTLVLGQTIGPALDAQERELLGLALRDADLVGVREAHSLRYARILRIPEERLSLQLDDAFFLAPTDGAGGASAADESTRRIAITLTRGASPLADMAAQLIQLVRETKARLVFVPHASAPDHDRGIGRELAAALAPHVELELLNVEDAGAARRRIDSMSMVISTRYHPLVFAMSAGIPCLGVYVDEYTRVKITGALRHGGLESWALPWALAREGALLEGARELWHRRNAVRRQIDLNRPRWQAMHREHWRRIACIVEGRFDVESASSGPAGVEYHSGACPTAAWARQAHELRVYSDHLAQERLDLIQERDEAVRYALSLRSALDAQQEENVALRRALDSHPSNSGEAGEALNAEDSSQ